MKKNFLSLLLSAALIVPFVHTLPVSAANDLPSGFVIETLAEDLFKPTALSFAPDGRIFVAQQNGVVRIIENGTLLSEPFIELDDINVANDRGLIGMALDPDFANNHYVYLAYTFENDPNAADDGGKKTARVLRVTEDNNEALPYDNDDIILGTVGGTPSNPSCADYPEGSDCIASDSLSHTIGGLRFGADGKLYVTTGDGAGYQGTDAHAIRAQDLDHLSGKVLRINTDGTAAAGNPFFKGGYTEDDNRSKIWAYGFRNPYRFNFQPDTGALLVGNVGWFSFEEINYVEPGKNYGWPCREGDESSIGYSDPNQFTGCPLTDDPNDSDYSADYVDPIFQYSHDGNGGFGAVTAGAFFTNEMYPSSHRDQYVFADYVTGVFQTMNIGSGGSTSGQQIFATDAQSAVEIVESPDGIVYMITRNNPSSPDGDVQRIIYTQDPVAVITTPSIQGNAPFAVQFNGNDSQSLGNGSLSYAWDFGNGSTAQGSTVSHTYPTEGIYTVTLTITSSNGKQSTADVVITVDPEIDLKTDVDPVFVNFKNERDPQYIGSPAVISAEVENISGDDPFRIRYELVDEDGTVLPTIITDDIIIAPSARQKITTDLSLPLGDNVVTATFLYNDGSPIPGKQSERLIVTVVSRAPVVPQGSEDKVVVYRFYSETYKGHFYTTSVAEKENLEANDPNWKYEGIAYNAFSATATNVKPVYRFYSDAFKGHFYTVSESEKTATESDANWKYEGIAYYVAQEPTATTFSVHRFWSDVYKHHFYTASEAERDAIIAEDKNWTYEGVGWNIEM